jgi:hypothetical protein
MRAHWLLAVVGAAVACALACIPSYTFSNPEGSLDGSAESDGTTLAADASDTGVSADANDVDANDAGTRPLIEGGTDAGLSDAGCPSGRGPAMVQLEYPGASFCVDSTEVTQGEYTQFLSAIQAGYQPALPPRCGWVNTFALNESGGCNLGPGYPACLNWCQAYAYCAWSGRRLCGAIAGGPVAPDLSASPGVGQWVTACTSNGTTTYAFGQNYQPVCNLPNPAMMQTPLYDGSTPAGSLTDCVGPPGVYDMIGNVFEWLDSCGQDLTDDSGASDGCQEMGGDYGFSVDCLTHISWPRSFSNIGFRCCWP